MSVPPALKAARKAWRACKDENRRLALWDTCRRLERLYNVLPETVALSDADVRAARFAQTRHPMIKILKNPTRGPV
jgi:hypothetical protein